MSGMRKYPLLIGGSPRSGTTALLQVLNSNPQVYLSAEENLPKLALDLGKTLGTQERRAQSLANGMRALSVRETLSAENIQSHNFTANAAWPTLRYLYQWHHRQMHDAATLLLWGDKLPNYYRELDAVLALPKVRYIHLTRNPLDVINSMLRRTEMARQGRDWWKAVTEFDAMLDTWAAAYAAVQANAAHRSLLHLHYEDLLFDFDASMQRINTFAEVDLTYHNILLADPSLHFDRQYLTPELIDRIRAHPAVIAYRAALSPAERLARKMA
jgi:hypothetical protein